MRQYRHNRFLCFSTRGGLCLVLLLVMHSALAAETPLAILKAFNTSTSFNDAGTCLTGRLEKQWFSVHDKRVQQQIMHTHLMKQYSTVVLPNKGGHQSILVTHAVYRNGKALSGKLPLLFQFNKVKGDWKLEWLSSCSVILDMFTREFRPKAFHTNGVFHLDKHVFTAKSAVATYHADNKTGTWINIRFYPFPFQQRDLEFLKCGEGPTVTDKNAPTALASSLTYPNVHLDILVDKQGRASVFSLGWTFPNGNKMAAKAISPPISTVGLQRFEIKHAAVTLYATGASKVGGNTQQWSIKMNALPLLKKGT